MKGVLAIIGAITLIFGAGITVMDSFSHPTAQAEIASPVVSVMPTPTDSPTPTPTLIPTPTIDIQALQRRAVLQTRLGYINNLIPRQEQKVSFDQYVYNDVVKSASVTQVDGVYINPASGEQAMIQMAEELQNDKNTLNQLIEERNEIQAELGIN